jgi:hypothetical protein
MPRYFIEANRRLFLETAIVADDKDTAENDARTLIESLPTGEWDSCIDLVTVVEASDD